MADSFQAEANQRRRLRCKDSRLSESSAPAINHPHSSPPHTTQPQSRLVRHQGDGVVADRPSDRRDTATSGAADRAEAGGGAASSGACVEVGERETDDSLRQSCDDIALLPEGIEGIEPAHPGSGGGDASSMNAEEDSISLLGGGDVKSLREAQGLARQLSGVDGSSEGGRVVMMRGGRMLAKFLRTQCHSVNQE